MRCKHRFVRHRRTFKGKRCGGSWESYSNFYQKSDFNPYDSKSIIDHIQYVFPNIDRSRFVVDLPTALTSDDVRFITTNNRFRTAIKTMIQHYRQSIQSEGLSTDDKMRITRILTSLKLMGKEKQYNELYDLINGNSNPFWKYTQYIPQVEYVPITVCNLAIDILDEDNGLKVGIGLAGNCGRLWGDCGNEINNRIYGSLVSPEKMMKTNYRTQEESVVCNMWHADPGRFLKDDVLRPANKWGLRYLNLQTIPHGSDLTQARTETHQGVDYTKSDDYRLNSLESKTIYDHACSFEEPFAICRQTQEPSTKCKYDGRCKRTTAGYYCRYCNQIKNSYTVSYEWQYSGRTVKSNWYAYSADYNYILEDTYKKYLSSLDPQYREISIQVNSNTYTVNFEKMIQMETNGTRDVRRVEHRRVEHKVVVVVTGGPNNGCRRTDDGATARTLDPNATDWNYFQNGIIGAFKAMLREMHYKQVNVALLPTISGGIYAGGHKPKCTQPQYQHWIRQALTELQIELGGPIHCTRIVLVCKI